MLNKSCYVLMLIAMSGSMSIQAAERCQMIGGYPEEEIKQNLAKLNIDTTASSYEELHNQLQAGAMRIYVPGNATITIPNKSQALILHKGQKIISDRGVNGSKGALLIVEKGLETLPYKYPVIAMNSDSRITGFRIEGPVNGSESSNKTIGIQFLPGASNIQVDNNEIYYWPWAGVSVKTAKNNLVNNNYIHDNKKSGLGYGVVVQNGNNQVEISCNTFNANRHSIAGSGEDGDSYQAYRNLVLNGGGKAAYHAFDMHKGSTGHGGKMVTIQDNIFDYGRPTTSNYSSVMLRGIPTAGKATISNNIFTQGWVLRNGSTAVSQVLGATYSAETLQQINKFNIPVSYSRVASGCFIHYSSTEDVNVPVDCASIETALNKD